MQTEIVLADSHRIVREGVRRIIEARDDLAVVGEASDGIEAVRVACERQPHVVVMEFSVPRLSGIEAIRRIRSEASGTHCIVLSAHQTRGPVEEAFRAGASGYVPKSAAAKELLDAVDAVRVGRRYLSPAIASHVVQALAGPAPGDSAISLLTGRERDVLQLIAEGLSNKEIASALNLSQKTIGTHRGKLMGKLGVHKATHLVRFAIREGLVAP